MSVETRTARTPSRERSSGFEDEPQLTMAKVPSDPAQVVVNHASFRVRLARPVTSPLLAETARLAAVPSPAPAHVPAQAPQHRVPAAWSGRPGPADDPGATRVLRPVPGPDAGTPGRAQDAGATRVLPRVTVDGGPPTVVAPRG
ncbi:hypothetical protein RKE29_30270, partial [Streptomyces sp. B1866]|nr:hypothetical protein [Streptomyces sp. B1866]